ncbi:hypothetical protein N7495_000814 [Penicillium taxi]|uniref:uncharacterized protein n=1 Tax=Penicillium taxi TaxID=168475 RepID=UPI00254591FB|nr:uncharacterized protein N7495_000814 [Penicillium taxi]KAJ5908132.1 hypothetical protein N7495_000814 [Penicillium taxi]
MSIESDMLAGATIELLEARLRRLTYLLGGATDWTGVPTTSKKPSSLDETVSRRLASLERNLDKLSRSVPAVRDVAVWRVRSHPPKHILKYSISGFWKALSPFFCLNTLFQFTNQANEFPDDRYPDLFQAPPPQDIPEGLSTQTLASIVLSYATAFPETSSRLTSLNDLPLPDAESSAALIELQPQMDRLAQVQANQAEIISELRVRTARVLQRWYEVGLLGSGECWAEWEGRLEDVEREVRRHEVLKEKRENEI